MDSIGDYIYIIMIAIAVLSGIFKSKNKKQEAKYEPEFEDETADEYGKDYDDSRNYGDTIEEVFTTDKEIAIPSPSTIIEQQSSMEKNNYQTAFTSLEGMSNYDNTKDSASLRAKKELTTTKQNKIEAPTASEPSIAGINLSTNEDVRAAFIASEIFNRKYS